MNFLKPITYGIAAGVAIAALAMPVEKAEARVIAYSSLQVTNFQFVSGAEIVNLDSVLVVNTTTSAANLNGANTSNSSPVNGAPGNPVANSDVSLSCLGACGGIAQNDYSQVSAANPGATFSRGDAALTGSLLTPGGASGQTVAESQLYGQSTSSANGQVSSIANFTTIDFETGQGGDMTLSFHVLGELLAYSDDAGGTAFADFDFNIVLQDRTNGNADVTIGVSSVNGEIDFSGLNELVSALGIESQAYTIDDTFTLTVTGLLANNQYRLQISQNSDISASSLREVAEPASMGLLGLGLLGVAGLASRRRKAA